MLGNVSWTPDPLAPQTSRVLGLQPCAPIQSVAKVITLGVLETAQAEGKKSL